jgi:hypothetical protein
MIRMRWRTCADANEVAGESRECVKRALVGFDGLAKTPRQTTGADGHRVPAAEGFALELQSERERGGGGIWRRKNGTSPELGLLMLMILRCNTSSDSSVFNKCVCLRIMLLVARGLRRVADSGGGG